MSDDLSPVEQFKQATSATLRSIAERDDIDVTFSNEPSGSKDAGPFKRAM